jgi:hypothetical protein
MTLNKNTDSKEPLEFYEHTTNIDPNYCDHRFHRISVTRILCKRCGLGFYDNPLSPFPVEEVNKAARLQKEENERLRNQNKDIVENVE